MNSFIDIADVSRVFGPKLSLGEKIAAKLGGNVETRSVHAVCDVTLSVRRGETLGLVGESGCGKSTLGRAIAGILPPTTGTITIDGAPVMVDGAKVTTRVQTVFQDPFASLDPRMKVGQTVAEGPIAHGLTTKGEARNYVASWFERVGLDPAWIERYPHQFSGGQRQRIAIARALAMQPDVLICDEPVASLDVSIQAQIINLFLELSHDLGTDLCLYQPRPVGDPARQRPCRRHVPGPYRRIGPGCRGFRIASPSLYRSSFRQRAQTGSGCRRACKI